MAILKPPTRYGRWVPSLQPFEAVERGALSMVPPVAMTSTCGRLRLWTCKFDEETPFFPHISWEIPWFPVGFSQSQKSIHWLRSWESHGSQGQKVKLIPHVEKQDQPSNWNKAKQQSRSDHPRLLEGLENHIDVWHGIPSGYGFMGFHIAR